jgi:hypothetical protein
MNTEPLGQMFLFHGTSDVANRKQRPLIASLDPTTPQGQGGAFLIKLTRFASKGKEDSHLFARTTR